MGRRKRTGWFARIIKVVASVSALLTWTGHIIQSVNAAVEKPTLPYKDNSNTGKHLPSVEEVDISVDSEPYPRQNPFLDSNCDIFYMVVSTIDGRVSALDLHKKGSLAWSVPADSTPLYSSSLASMEMMRNGKKLRLIPSLDGALYQFDGDKVEAVPMSAETLLSSTYRLGDDTMIVGSKDLRNYGISLRTGEVMFTCGSEGCTNAQGERSSDLLDVNDILVISRSTQVVRSVDIKNGQEKWNFSVGQHQASLPPNSKHSGIEDDDDDTGSDKTEDYNIPVFSAYTEECPGKQRAAEDIDYENFLRLLVPEGRVVALNKGDSSQVTWEHKFDSPIAKAWLLHHGKLESMSLFDGRHIPSLNIFSQDEIENESMPQPLLYIGSHQKLLYIQPSPQMETVLKTFGSQRIGHFIDPNIKVSWRPYLNTASVRTPVFSGNRPQISRGQHSTSKGDEKGSSTSLTVWHEDYPFDTGYFLYPEFRDSRSKGKDIMLIEDLHRRQEEEGGLMQTIPVSLWMYWKEIIAISLAVSLCVHVTLTKFFNPNRNRCPEPSESVVNDASRNSNSSSGIVVSSDSSPLLGDKFSPSGEYVSRFATDFDILHCLGKGGFGVVFEAINKVDDQHYAVKRTMLPKSEGAKEKVLREVKALAKLEHIGIVRYFNAWVESPPAGWQEERDKQFQFSDMSGGPTSCSHTTSYTGYRQESVDVVVQRKMKRQKMDKLEIPFDKQLRAKEEAILQTDSVIFAADTKRCHLKESGSGEFSVHSNLSDTVDQNDMDYGTSDKLFSYGFDLGGQSYDFSNSVNDSKSSIPFSNYTSNSSILFSRETDHSNQDMSGDSVVFESSGHGHSAIGKVQEETQHSIDDSIVFSNSHSVVEKQEGKLGVSLKKEEHHAVHITLSSHQKEGEEEEQAQPADQTQPATNFFLYIQMQLYLKETLKDWLSNNTLNRDRHTVLDIFDQLMCAVDYVHCQGLMHRDLKPSNIFFTEDGIVKVGDFGLVTALCVQQDQGQESKSKSNGKHTAEVGTTLYMSPEQIAKKPYDLKIDIFSLGLIFLELWIPFSTQMERIRTLQDAKKQNFPARFNRELPAECDLVHKMTNADPALRPSTKDILDHSLFQYLAPTRIGIRHRKRTISERSNS